MPKIIGLKLSPKLLVPLITILLLIAAFILLYNVSMGQGITPLEEAIAGGEYTITSIGRNHESLTNFVQADEEQAETLLDAAKVSLENARIKLASAGYTEDPYVLQMVKNYQTLAQASDVMAHGVENLLAISDNLKSALDYYAHGEYANASQEASYCLQILTPLVSDFETCNESLASLNYPYIASAHRNRANQATNQYRNEAEIYMQYILLLRSLLEGADYLETRELIEEYLRQLQSAIANEDYSTAQNLLDQISSLLESLRTSLLSSSEYQNAAEAASELDPNSLSGEASKTAESLKTRLKNLEGIEGLENYLESLMKYLEASDNFAQGEMEKAEQAAIDGLQGLGEGPGLGQGQGDPELERLYAGLREAFSSLLMQIRGQPDQG